MKWPPTDLRILEKIYRRYYSDFAAYSKEVPTRAAKNYVPIDIAAIAADLDIEVDIVFGRLYYLLEGRYGYTNPDGSVVHFLVLNDGNQPNAVHFPLLASVLAQLRSERTKHRIATWLSVAAIVISLVALWFSSQNP